MTEQVKVIALEATGDRIVHRAGYVDSEKVTFAPTNPMVDGEAVGYYPAGQWRIGQTAYLTIEADPA